MRATCPEPNKREQPVATVVLPGTLDTKGKEYAYLRDEITTHSDCEVLMVNAGVLGEPQTAADVPREEVAAAASTSIDELAAANDPERLSGQWRRARRRS